MNIKEERNETLRKCIANMYYYLELDEEENKDLWFKYQLRWSKSLFDHIYYAHENDKEEFEKALKRELQQKLKLTKIKKIQKYQYHSDERHLDIVWITVDVLISKSDYLDSLFILLTSTIPLVDHYNHRMGVDLDGVAQKYDLSHLKRLLSPEDVENIDFFDRKMY